MKMYRACGFVDLTLMQQGGIGTLLARKGCPDGVGTGEVSDADLTLKVYTSSNYVGIILTNTACEGKRFYFFALK